MTVTTRFRAAALVLCCAAAFTAGSRSVASPVASARGGGPPTSAPAATQPAAWRIGTPIVTYYAGPPMTEAIARQMADGGFNVVWCGEKDLDLLQKHGLRGMLHDALLTPDTLDAPAQREKLDALLARVRGHPALYSYYLTDEPSAGAFPRWGKLVAHLRERDPAHMAYINLFPTYANNEQLGTKGDVVTAYREHLRQYLDVVRPALVSYDHYQFYKGHDTAQYFLNLAMVRTASQDAGVPFLNIVQASAWQPGVRVPTADETRYLVYTTLGYGAQGISYYVYYAANHAGGIADAGGKPTPIYDALRTLNREFVAIATELQLLRSIGVYHMALKEAGCEPPPSELKFVIDPPAAPVAAGNRGFMLACFGRADQPPTHVLVINLDYEAEATTTLTGPGGLELFDASTGKWSPVRGPKAELRLPPGGGKLVRLGS